ncbi:acetylornithine deacetylase [Peribacillus butanolivorans]|uniref:Acetylornithine deacetylase n=1 Tax=Peribacillus butanolivorans TaxID=421767 RepID=A0AAX0RQU5_9BACI|nr:ArgE/DapE family deacylase [Peribacillus butanolivorans]PEJ29787.1 acetylornithine deacetylase [Peribacillus butanolivorans]
MKQFQVQDVQQNIQEAIEELWEEEVEFLKEIGRHKSTLGNENNLQRYIKKYLQGEMDLLTDSFSVDPKKISRYENFSPVEWSYSNRPVVVGQWRTDGPKIGKSLILQGHIDVVSAEPEHLWSYEPYNPIVIDNKLYGRGIADMKAGVAAMIFAVKAIQKSGIKLGADLQIQTVIEEECTGNGALALLDRGYVAEGALITEPTSLTAVKSQIGVIWMRVNVSGMGAHVERAQSAQNAINKACYLIEALEKYKKHINEQEKHDDFKFHDHPLNVNVGTIKGGDWPSNVPSECSFEVRIGLYPGTDPSKVQAEVKNWLFEAAKQDSWLRDNLPEVTFFGYHATGVELNTKNSLFKTLESAHQSITKKDLQYTAFTGTTDCRIFEEFGIPSTCYGPAGENIHGIDEYVNLDTVKTATQTIAAFILDWCGVR